jgi:flagellar biosynthesis protein
MAEEKNFRPNLWGQAGKSEKIIEKDKTAVAIAYNPGDAAPKILAAGKGEVAERIIETAKENDVPFYQDNSLAETLSRLKIGDTIPPELYSVVAEILVFVDDMDKMKGKLEKAGLV